MTTKSLTDAQSFLKFVNASPSPFHAVEELIQRLVSAGFKELSERNAFDVQPNGKYYFTRNKSCLIAFSVGGKFQKGSSGINIVAGHTDSPCLKIKPISKRSKLGYEQVGVSTYGGGLWHTWFDRDLKVAGRVLYSNGENKGVTHKLIHVEKPVLRIPTLAIHLHNPNNDGFKINAETQLFPVSGSTSKCKSSTETGADDKKDGVELSTEYTAKNKHSREILNIIAEECQCKVDDILDFEICLADNQPANLGGINEEFLFAPRLDNLMSCYTGLQAFIQASDDGVLSNETNIQMLACFDNEEIGSVSAYGAHSSILRHTISRIVGAASQEEYEMIIAKSMLISSDMAHAVHPNYEEKHESVNRPYLHKGIVIKTNVNQRYATTSVTASILRSIAKTHNVPMQDFVVRNDSGCGSTIGPMLSADLGIRTVDIGIAQLSMHSIREMCGADDVTHSINLLKGFYQDFSTVEKKFIIE